MRRKTAIALVAAGLALSTLGAPAVYADPDNVDQLIAETEELSREAEAQTERLKGLEEQVEQKSREVEEKKRHVEEVKAQAEAARQAVNAYQVEVNKIAQSKYRGASIDPLTSVISAQDPRDAIERAGYMNSLSRKTESVISSLHQAVKEANDAHNRAAAATAQAEFERGELEAQRKEVEHHQEELAQRTRELQDRIDSLNEAERARWMEKNGPMHEYSLVGLSGTNPSGMDALSAGMTKIGAPYGWGATGPDVFDCSGLVVWSYAQQGKMLPRTSQAQMAGGVPVSRAELQPGDVVGFYPGATHVGIYAGNGMILHASDYGIPVQVVPMDSMPFYGARRY